MKKHKLFFHYLAALAVIALVLLPPASCQKCNHMGELRGQWQLMTVERPGLPTETPRDPRLYISFDQNVIQLTSSDDNAMFDGRYAGKVVGETPDLLFDFPYNTDPQTLQLIQPWGIDENPATVKVEKLDKSQLRMKVGDNILTLRRF